MNIELAANIVGVMGTFLVVSAYLLMQLNKLDSKDLAFNVVNLLGAILLLLSLLVHFNVASFIIELFWITASLIGIYNSWQSKSR